jgi:hypothetical protein
MKSSSIKKLIKFNHEHNRKACLTIEGQPGLGKSAAVYQAVQELGVPLIEFRPGNHGIEDLIGLPNFTADGMSTFAKPDWLPNEERDGKNGVLFIDEFAQAAVPMQNALSSLIHEPRQLHDYKFPESWMIVVAYNGPKWRAATNRMPSHIQDRLKPEIEMSFNLDDWVEWAIAKDIHPALQAFAKFKPGMLDGNKFNPGERFNATPRSLAACHAYVDAPVSIRVPAINGIIGSGNGAELCAFINIWQSLPDIEQIIRNPSKIAVPTKPDVLCAIVESIAYRCDHKNADHLSAFASRLSPEHETIYYKLVLQRERIKPSKNSVATTKSFADFLDKNAELVI